MSLMDLTLGNLIARGVGAIVARVLAALGMGVVSYVGVQLGIEELVQQVVTNFQGIGSNLTAIAGLAGLDVLLSLVISAQVTAITLRVTMGAFRGLGSVTD